MTKINSKYLSAGVAALLAVVIAAPNLVQASIRQQDKSNQNEGGLISTSTTPTATDKTSLCQKIVAEHDKAVQQLTSGREQVLSKKQGRLDQFGEKRTEASQKLNTLRGQWGTNLEQQYVKLESRATTDAQKAAVKNFETAINQAVKTRQAAVDAAVKAYQDGVKATIDKRDTDAAAALATYKTSVDNAFKTAQTACSSSTSDPKNIRKNLQTSLKNARQTYQNALKSIDGKSSLAKLIKTRNEAILKAAKDFQAVVKAQTRILKVAFGETESATATSTPPTTNTTTPPTTNTSTPPTSTTTSQ